MVNPSAFDQASRAHIRHFSASAKAAVAVAFFDADGTIRTSLKNPGGFIAGVDDIALLPHVSEKIRDLNRRGIWVVVVSNQAGVGRFTTRRAVDLELQETARLLEARGARIDYFDFAEKFDRDRKPDVGMAARFIEKLSRVLGRKIRLNHKVSFIVGDQGFGPEDVLPSGERGRDLGNSDRGFAVNLKIPFRSARSYFGWSTNPSARSSSINPNGPSTWSTPTKTKGWRKF